MIKLLSIWHLIRHISLHPIGSEYMNETSNILVLETGRRSDATYPYSLFMNERHIADIVSLGGALLFLYEELANNYFLKDCPNINAHSSLGNFFSSSWMPSILTYSSCRCLTVSLKYYILFMWIKKSVKGAVLPKHWCQDRVVYTYPYIWGHLTFI